MFWSRPLYHQGTIKPSNSLIVFGKGGGEDSPFDAKTRKVPVFAQNNTALIKKPASNNFDFFLHKFSSEGVVAVNYLSVAWQIGVHGHWEI